MTDIQNRDISTTGKDYYYYNEPEVIVVQLRDEDMIARAIKSTYYEYRHRPILVVLKSIADYSKSDKQLINVVWSTPFSHILLRDGSVLVIHRNNIIFKNINNADFSEIHRISVIANELIYKLRDSRFRDSLPIIRDKITYEVEERQRYLDQFRKSVKTKDIYTSDEFEKLKIQKEVMLNKDLFKVETIKLN